MRVLRLSGTAYFVTLVAIIYMCLASIALTKMKASFTDGSVFIGTARLQPPTAADYLLRTVIAAHILLGIVLFTQWGFRLSRRRRPGYCERCGRTMAAELRRCQTCGTRRGECHTAVPRAVRPRGFDVAPPRQPLPVAKPATPLAVPLVD